LSQGFEPDPRNRQNQGTDGAQGCIVRNSTKRSALVAVFLTPADDVEVVLNRLSEYPCR
jgi:hypothetical protein